MHAFLIADYEIVDSLEQLTNKQHMMACGTTFIDIHQDTANNPIDLNNNYYKSFFHCLEVFEFVASYQRPPVQILHCLAV